MEQNRDREQGMKAYASQFRIPEGEVPGTLQSIIGDEMTEDCLLATGRGWGDGPLSWRERNIASISTMIAQGGVDRRLESHLRWGLSNGLTIDELKFLIRFTAAYVGYPRATQAMELLLRIQGTDAP